MWNPNVWTWVLRHGIQIQVRKTLRDAHVTVQDQNSTADMCAIRPTWTIKLSFVQSIISDTETVFLQLGQRQKVRNTAANHPHLNRPLHTPFSSEKVVPALQLRRRILLTFCTSDMCSVVRFWWKLDVLSRYSCTLHFYNALSTTFY